MFQHYPFAPDSAKAVKNSFPSPLAAPVTTHVLPSSEKAGSVIIEREYGKRLALNARLPRRAQTCIRLDLEALLKAMFCSANQDARLDYKSRASKWERDSSLGNEDDPMIPAKGGEVVYDKDAERNACGLLQLICHCMR